MNINLILGKRGELAAKKYLINNNYKIIESNYKKSHQEIDIIAKKNKEYIFVEVKTRLKNIESKNEVPLSPRQIKNLKIAILNYAHENNLCFENIRFDLIYIIVERDKNTAELKHYQNAF